MDTLTTTTTSEVRSTTPIGLKDFDRATLALDKAAAVLSTTSAAYDSATDSFGPRDGHVWLTLLAALDLVDEARNALAMRN